MTSRSSCDFPAQVFLEHKSKWPVFVVFTVVNFHSEKSVFKYLRHTCILDSVVKCLTALALSVVLYVTTNTMILNVWRNEDSEKIRVPDGI